MTLNKISTTTQLSMLRTRHIQGVSENMQQLLTSTKIRFKQGRVKIIYQMKAYIHAILSIIKNPENDTK